jgi:hypothetical protein
MRTDLHQLVADYRRLQPSLGVYPPRAFGEEGQKES